MKTVVVASTGIRAMIASASLNALRSHASRTSGSKWSVSVTSAAFRARRAARNFAIT